MDERDMEEEGKDKKRKGWGIGKNINFWNCIFMFVIRNPKARRANKAFIQYGINCIKGIITKTL
jgi:hypothetical protein